MIHTVLPVQYLPRTNALAGPQRRLMIAVLQTALDDCHGTATARALGLPLSRDRRATRDALAFFLSQDRSWPYSFVNICEAVGFDPEALRRTVWRRLSDGD
jgi:hypothetical protein